MDSNARSRSKKPAVSKSFERKVSIMSAYNPVMKIPDFAFLNRHDGTVFVYSFDENGQKHRKTIGRLTTDTAGTESMIPNQYFKDHFRNLWNENFSYKKTPPHELQIGLYGLTRTIAQKTGLYEELSAVYEVQNANAIFDYAMFLLQHASKAAESFEDVMAPHVLFSGQLHSDSWYSDFFAKTINEDMHHAFRIAHITRLKANGLKKVWLSIDGSGNDDAACQSRYAQLGSEESLSTDPTMVGYLYAIDAATGCPVSYFPYDGPVPDAQAFQRISLFLSTFSIEIEGIVLPEEFATEPVFDVINAHSWKYMILLPPDSHGHIQMVTQHGPKIRWNPRFLLEDDVVFAISDRQRLFETSDRVSSICLFFDGPDAATESQRLTKKIRKEVKRCMEAIYQGKDVSIANGMEKYLSIAGEGQNRRIVEHRDQWRLSIESFGFFSLAVSDGITPELCNMICKSRKVSETQLAILKIQEGGQTAGLHKTEGMLSKFAVSFISSIIRFEIEKACRELNTDSTSTIQELIEIVLNDRYEFVRALTGEQKALFGHYDLDQNDLVRMAREYAARSSSAFGNSGQTMPGKYTPVIIPNSHKRGRKKVKPDRDPSDGQAQESEAKPKSKGGRPAGKKDSVPRKPRSDKGKIRGPRNKS